ncbi:MAG: hypothetical protein RRX95_00205 [Oscillospiraceae bacterium]
MTVIEFGEKYTLKALSCGGPRDIKSGFCGDLLSWVMANAREDCAWFTVMGNINAIAVASLNDISCVVLCQNSAINPDALEKAIQEEITVFSTEKTVFEMAGLLAKELN